MPVSEIVAWSEGLTLGVDSIDQQHIESIELINRVADAVGVEFVSLFTQLQQHLQQHFEDEDRLMQQSGFPATAEHKGEHHRVLGELSQFTRQLEKGRSMMARAYVKERLPGWFTLHITTMDSALAAHLKR